MPTLSGTVTDVLTGNALKGIVVLEVETGLSVATDASGAWSLVTPNASDHSLAFSLGVVRVAQVVVTAGTEASAILLGVDASGLPLTGAGAPYPGSTLEAKLAGLLGLDGAQVVLGAVNAALQARTDLALIQDLLQNVGFQGGDNVWRGTNNFVGFTGCGIASGAVPDALTTVVATELGIPGWHQTVLTVTNAHLTITDNSGLTGYGSLHVYDFPTGNILILGAVANAIAITKSTSGINATFRSAFSMGTAAVASDAVKTGTKANLLPSKTNAQAVAGATTASAISTAAPAPLDGTNTTTSGAGLPVYLNFTVNPADETATPGDLILNGQLVLTWVSLGDY